MFDLTGQTALVTGASGGIGGAIATRAAQRRGPRSCWPGRAARRWKRSPASSAHGAHVGVADLAEPAAADRLVKQAEPAMGRVDILVNNAGLARDGLVLRMKDEDWQTVLDVDLTAAFRLIRAALRGMVRRRHGRIIGVTSIVAVTGNPGQANYAAAKAAMIGMSKSIAAEVAGRGITVNCVAPGFIESGDDRQTAAGAARSAWCGDSGRPVWRLRPTSPPRSSIWRAPRPPMSPDKPCTSMAAWPWYRPRMRQTDQPIGTARGNHVM